MDNIKLTGNSKLLKKTKSKINPIELSLALAEATECGNGLNPLKGYVVLPNFNSSSGDIDSRYALYIVDGEIVVEPIQDAKDAINSFCNNSLVSASSVSISGCLTGQTLTVGGTRQLTKSVLPSTALQTGTWSTSNAAIATVNSSGLVTAVSAGTATITFTTTDGGFTANCSIVVVTGV